MANNRSRLTPVVDIAQVREKDAAIELSRKMELRDKVFQQLEQMRLYREEYKNNSIVGKNHTPETLADIQIFLSRLNKSIDGIERQLLAIETELNRLTDQWQKSRVWTRSLEKAVERDLSRIAITKNRQEQKDNDEIASRTGDRNYSRNQ